jgi:hypothetical protein
MELRDHSDESLLASVTKLTGSHRQLTAELVAHLAEIEARDLQLVAGFSSMFEFCTKALRFSEGEAFRRILAARLCRRFPGVYGLLASGDVNLSTLELLRPWLTEENNEELLAAVSGRRKHEVQALLAERFPQPDRPSSIRRVTLEPLSVASFRVEFTASAALREKLEHCRDLMSHANPSRELAVVIERAVDLLLKDLERKRLGKTEGGARMSRDRQGTTSDIVGARGPERRGVTRGVAIRGGQPPRVPNAVRREVYERDGIQCTYVAENGRRCETRAFLELDHEMPKALDGSSSAENLRVRCRAHNQLWAREAFGGEHIARSRHLRQQRSPSARSDHAPTSVPQPAAHLESRAATFEKVRLALRGLGFRDAQAKNSIARVARMHPLSESLTLEQVFREALSVATAA